MAEPIRTYQRQLRPGINIPQMDTSGAQEQVRYYQQLSKSLDNMASFFYKVADAKAKIEGAEYGPEVAPDGKQIDDAFNMPTGTADADAKRTQAITDAQGAVKGKLEGIGDGFSTFGTNARESAMVTTYNDLAVLAKKRILDLKLAQDRDPNNPNLTPDLIKAEYESIIAGFAGAFDDVNPSYARKFRAEMNLYAYGELETITKKFNKENKNQLLAGFEVSFQQDIDSISTWWEVGMPVSIADDGSISFVDDTVQDRNAPGYNEQEAKKRQPATKALLEQALIQKQAEAVALGKSPEYVKQMKTRWDAEVLLSAETEVGLFISGYSTDTNSRSIGYNTIDMALAEMQRGAHLKQNSSFMALPKNIQNILSYYRKDKDGLIKLKAAARTQLANDLSIENQVHGNADTNRTNSIEYYNRQIVQTIVDPELDQATKNQVIRKAAQNIMLLDSKKGGETMELLEGLVGPQFDLYGTETNFQFTRMESVGSVIQAIERDLAQDPAYVTTTHAKLLRHFADGEITYKDLTSLSDRLASTQSVEGKEIMKRVRSALKMPDNLILSTQNITAANLALHGRIENRLAEAMRKQDFNAFDFMTEVLDIIQRGEDADGSNLYVNMAARVNLSGLGITFAEFEENYRAEIADNGVPEARKLELRELYQDLLKIQEDGNGPQLNEQLPKFFQ